MMVTHHDAYVSNESSLGYCERLQHLDMVRSGQPVYMIMCRVDDPNASPREVDGFNKDDVFVGGELIERDGDSWLEFVDRVDFRSVRPQE